MNWKTIHYIARWGNVWTMACGLKLNPEEDNSENPICTINITVTTCKNCLRSINANPSNTATRNLSRLGIYT